MMRGLIIPLVLFLILFSQDIYAQEEGIEYPRFRIMLKSGEFIEGREGYFTSTAFNGFLGNGKEIAIDLNDVSEIYVSSGFSPAFTHIAL